MTSEPKHTEEHPAASEGTMDLTDHLKTWNGFWEATKWSTVACIVLAIFLAIFRTHN